MGQVNHPEEYSLPLPVRLSDAIRRAGGLTDLAAPWVKVGRQTDGGSYVYHKYYLPKIKSGTKADPLLQDGDRVHVSTIL
jgi:protein involved in polysaccharide export with SLBB domain